MSTRRTPPMDCFGVYELVEPWFAAPTKCYYTRAIRKFTDLRVKNIDPFKLAYEPYGSTAEACAADEVDGACIISLFAEDGEVIYVPDTKIVSYPNMGNYVYRHIVLSISLGALPDGVSLDWLKTKISEDCYEISGVSSKIQVAEAPVTGTISDTDHERMEAARRAAKKSQVTTAAQLAIAKAQLAEMTQKYNDLEKVVMANGLVNKA